MLITLFGLLALSYSALAQINTLSGVRTAGQTFGGISTIQAAISDAGMTGIVIIPADYAGADTYTNPNDITILDFRTGSRARFTANRSFGTPQMGFNLWDTSPAVSNTGCGGLGPSGIGNVAPQAEFCGHYKGSGTPVPIYSFSELLAGFTGYGGGMGFNIVANRGSLPQQIFHNILIADNSGWDITSCSRTSNMGTCTIKTTNAPNLMRTGYGFYISGNPSFNTGRGINIVTAVTANSVSWSSPGGNIAPTVGGVLAPNHTNWALEVNAFNNSHDPTVPTPISAQNNQPYHGITSTQLGLFPLSEGFFADGQFYDGFLSAGGIHADFVCGYPLQGQTYTLSDICTEARPYNVAVAGANFPSKKMKFTSSVWNGSTFTEPAFYWRSIPTSPTAVNSPVEMELIDPSGNIYYKFLGNQTLAGSGSPSKPNFSGQNCPTCGFYVNASGFPAITVNGTETMSWGSVSTTSIKPMTMPAAQITNSVTAGAGMQHMRGAVGCTTAAEAGAVCSSGPLALPVASGDTNYTLTCSLESPTGIPIVSSVARSTGSFTITIAAMTAVAATGNFDCIYMHD